MNRPKLHHYVPRFYLQGFADREKTNSIWVYAKGADHARLQGIKNTAAETDYYTIATSQGEKDTLIETEFLAPIESAAKPIIEHLRSAPRPSVAQDAVQPLAAFLTALYVRSPRARHTSEQLFTALAAATAKKSHKIGAGLQDFLDSNPDISAEQLQEVMSEIDDPTKWHLSVRKDLQVPLQFMGLGDFYPYFARMTSCVLIGSGDPEFVTCDSPLSVFALDRLGRATIGVGIGLRQVEVVLPLSPERALRLTPTRQPVQRRVSKQTVHDINRRLLYQTLQYVYASRNSARIANFVTTWFEKRQELGVDHEAMDKYATDIFLDEDQE